MAEEDKPKEEGDGFSPGTIIFAFSLFGICLLLLVPSVYKHLNKEPPVVITYSGTQSGDATFYSVGLTGCGEEYKDSDMVAGVGKMYWLGKGNPKNDPMCQTQVKVTSALENKKGKKKSVTVLIQDKCVKCKPGEIQLSPAAFEALGQPLTVERFPVTWEL